MWYKCLFTVVWLYRGTPHAGVPFVGELRGGFIGYRLCRRPLILDVSMFGGLDAWMCIGYHQFKWIQVDLGGFKRVLVDLHRFWRRRLGGIWQPVAGCGGLWHGSGTP